MIYILSLVYILSLALAAWYLRRPCSCHSCDRPKENNAKVISPQSKNVRDAFLMGLEDDESPL